MAKDDQTTLSDAERAIVQRYADERGISLCEAASELASRGIERRVRRRARRSPASNVVTMRARRAVKAKGRRHDD